MGVLLVQKRDVFVLRVVTTVFHQIQIEWQEKGNKRNKLRLCSQKREGAKWWGCTIGLYEIISMCHISMLYKESISAESIGDDG